MSKQIFLLLAVWIVGAPLAQADTFGVACSRKFAAVMNNSYILHFSGNKVKSAAEIKLEKLAAVNIEEIFPEKIYRGGSANPKNAIKFKVTRISQKRFNDHFDQLWDNRVRAGIIPSWELKEYRAWLKKQAGSEGPYPALEPRQLLKMAGAPEGDDAAQLYKGKVQEYFDEKYLEYLEKTKFIHPESVDEYFRTVDKRLIHHMYEATSKRTYNFVTGWMGGALIATLFWGPLNDVSQMIWSPFSQHWRESVKSTATGIKEYVTDWSVFQGGEDKYVQTLAQLKRENYILDRVFFSKLNRAEAIKRFENYTSSAGELLPKFQPLVEREDKQFMKNWESRVEGARLPLTQIHANFTQMKSHLLNLKREIEARGADYKVRPAEQEQMKFLEEQLVRDQSYLASLLADWLFLKNVRGESNPLSPDLNRAFRYVYENYLETMDIDGLSKALGRRMQAHANQLENYSNKAKGMKVDPSTLPEVKPEDQINKEGLIIDKKDT